MNPGTVLFIVLGLIGLLIYISKALKPSSLENFAVIDESQISNKGKEGLDKLKDGTLNFESLFSAFSTPDVNLDVPSRFSNGTAPSVADFAKLKKPQMDFLNMNESLPNPLPVQPSISTLPTENLGRAPQVVTPKPVIVNKTPALPVLTPASLITMPNQVSLEVAQPQPPMTISDMQGSIYKPAAEPFGDQKKDKQNKPRTITKTKTKVIYVPNKCPKMPDMSQYIRKDSIPCWGCNLK
jgi:hypothetical protein